MASENVSTPAEILKRPYHRVVVPDESGLFGAEIAEFPGCLAVGDTAADALANLEEVAEGWLLGVIERKQPIPAPSEEPEYSGKLVLRLSKSLHESAANAAERDGVSLNSFIVTALARYVGANEAVRPIVTTSNTYNYFHVATSPGQPLLFGGVGNLLLYEAGKNSGQPFQNVAFLGDVTHARS